MNVRSLTRTLAVLPCLVSLCACGSGGGKATDPVDGATPVVDAAPPAPDATGSGETHVPDAAPSSAPDAAVVAPDAAVVLPDAAPPVPDAAATQPPPAPLPRPVNTNTVAAPGGWRWARGLIHMHSVHSHDACDGRPKDADGNPNLPCLADLRHAVCNARLDYMLLTDHPETFADVPFDQALLYDQTGGDQLVADETGAPIGNYVGCTDDGADAVHTLIAPGSEGDIMPVLLPRPAADRAWYRTRTPEAVASLHETGGLVLHAHTEERTFEELAPLGLDGIEIYNLHANVNPRWHQLGEVLPDITTLINCRVNPPHPDLSLLAVLRENPEALGVWDQFVLVQRMLGTAGSDIHENLPPLVRPIDGERLDSYRRLTTWFANYLLVHDVTLDALREALQAGRNTVVFHLMGEPDGFDYAAFKADGTRIEMGTEMPFEPGLRIHVQPPTSVATSEQDIRLLEITVDGPQIVAQGQDAIDYTPQAAGVFRVEIYQTPEHLRTLLGSLADTFVRPTPWIYTNPIYLR